MSGSGVVACFDGSVPSVQALKWGVSEATMRRVPLTICHVRDEAPPSPPSVWDMMAQGIEVARKREPGLELRPELVTGSPAAALLAVSASAELLVAGARGNGRWRWPGLGSVSSQLAARTQCPLLLVPDNGYWRDEPVLLGVDGGLSEHAAGFAFGEAYLRDVPVRAVGWSADPEGLDIITGPWRSKYPDVPVFASRGVRSPGLTAGQTMRDLAETASLVVVGTRSAGDAPGLPLGTVAHELLQNTAYPIAIVP